MKTVLNLLLIISIFFGCQISNPESNQVVRKNEELSTNQISKAVLATIAVVGESFKILSSKPKILLTKRGTHIHIPANAFVDKTGKRISGEIDFMIKEFHTQGEILSSNIPMVYMVENGNKIDFESAGMFELRASQNGNELELAKDKEIKVEMVTDVTGAFNFYNLLEDSTNWDILARNCQAIQNNYRDEKQAELDSLESNIPEKPKNFVSYKKGDQLFDLKTNLINNEALHLLHGVMWKYSGTTDSLNPAKHTEFFLENYDLVSLNPTDAEFLEYTLEFKKGKKSVSFTAIPVFQGKMIDLQNERLKEKFSKINEALARQKKLQEELEREQKLLRVFNVEKLGIYNYDRQFKDPQAIEFKPVFTFDGRKIEDVNVFLVPGEKRVVIKYTATSFRLFRINPVEHNKLLAILPDGSIFALSSKEIREMKLNTQNEGKKITFDLKSFRQKVENASTIDNVLAKL